MRSVLLQHLPSPWMSILYHENPNEAYRQLKQLPWLSQRTVEEFQALLNTTALSVLKSAPRHRNEKLADLSMRSSRIKREDKEESVLESDEDAWVFPEPSDYKDPKSAPVSASPSVPEDAPSDSCTEFKHSMVKGSWDYWKPGPEISPPDGALATDWTWFCLVWARVNFIRLLGIATSKMRYFYEERRERAVNWVNRQTVLLQALYNAKGKDADVDQLWIARHYAPLGPSWYKDSTDLIKQESVLLPGRTPPSYYMNKYFPEKVTLESCACRIRKVVARACTVESDPEAEELLRLLTPDDPDREEKQTGTNAFHWLYPFHLRSLEVIRTHSIYAACIIRIGQCSAIRRDATLSLEERDAAYRYQLSFVDLFGHCFIAGRWDDKYLLSRRKSAPKVSPWSIFRPWKDRAFSEGDLPDLAPVIWRDIVFEGDRKSIKYTMGTLLQKSMPFAGQRRSIYKPLLAACKDDTCWRIFRRVMWCGLMGVYPGSTSRPRGLSVLRFHLLCQNKDMLMKTLSPADDAPAGRSCAVIFTVFRLYIATMALRNEIFLTGVPLPNWTEVMTHAQAMSAIIRESNTLSMDPFAHARFLLNEYITTIKPHVYRYRKGSIHHKVLEVFTKALTTTVLMEREITQTSLSKLKKCRHFIQRDKTKKAYKLANSLYYTEYRPYLCKVDPKNPRELLQAIEYCVVATNERIAQLSWELPLAVKDRILNLVAETPREKWCDVDSLSLLAHEEYGGISKGAVVRVARLIMLITAYGKPSHCNAQLSAFGPKELFVFSWYWYCVGVFDAYYVVPLPGNVAEKIDAAMKQKRYRLMPGLERLSVNAYTVFATICCGRLSCETGKNKGHDGVRFDESLCDVVCKRSKKPRESEHKDDMRGRVQAYKAAFFHVPCREQPVLRLNLRGKMLVYKSARTAHERYMFCPECAGFHMVDPDCWLAGDYRCADCATQSAVHIPRYSCAYCGQYVFPHWNSRTAKWEEPQEVLDVWRPLPGSDPADSSWEPLRDPLGIVERLVFCEKHYGSGKVTATWANKQVLWERIAHYTTLKTINNSSRF